MKKEIFDKSFSSNEIEFIDKLITVSFKKKLLISEKEINRLILE